MAKIRLDKFDGGLADNWWEDSQINMSAKNNQIVSGTQNPFTNPGFYSPGVNELTDLAQQSNISSMTNTCVRFLTFDDNKYYTTTGTSIFYFIDDSIGIIGGGTILGTADTSSNFPTTIAANDTGAAVHVTGAHTSQKFDDAILYQVNGASCIWFFWRDNTDGDAGVYKLGDNGISSSDYWSVSTTNGFVFPAVNVNFPIIPIVSSNGYAYIAQKNVVHKLDGTTDGGATGTITANVLKFPASEMIVDMVEAGNKVYMLKKPSFSKADTTGRVSRKCGVSVWNRVSTVVSAESYIPISGVQDVFNIIYADTLYVFAVNNLGNIVLMRYNGQAFVPEKEINVYDYSNTSGNGRPANRGAVMLYHDGIVWKDGKGMLMYYDIPKKALHILEYRTTYTGGAIIASGIKTILESYKVSSTNHFAQFDYGTNTFDAGGVTTYFPNIQLPKLSTINGVTIFCTIPSGAPSAGSVAGNFFPNMSSSAGSYSLNPSTQINNGSLWIPFHIANVNTIQMTMLFDGSVDRRYHPLVYAIEFDYTPTSKLK